MKRLAAIFLLTMNVISLMPAKAAWYDYILETEASADSAINPEMESTAFSQKAPIVAIQGHFTFTGDNAMALRLKQDNDEVVIARLTEMGFEATAHEDLVDGIFVLVNVGETDPASAAEAFAEYGEVMEIWVTQSLYNTLNGIPN